uniref:Uncharacterized protein n=1 Tax=Pristionchus pacificus TaxID=54126 RepID=A0A2A6C7J2_PRIPA|eukprot:PDM74182.1 hypothetical protein PRIPAC_41538 [Pristionchus pacificus]
MKAELRDKSWLRARLRSLFTGGEYGSTVTFSMRGKKSVFGWAYELKKFGDVGYALKENGAGQGAG